MAIIMAVAKRLIERDGQPMGAWERNEDACGTKSKSVVDLAERMCLALFPTLW